MRRIELSTELAASVEDAWDVLVDTERWSEWGRLATSARGRLERGATWRVTLRPEPDGSSREMRPRLVSVRAPGHLRFETRIGGRWSIRMLHAFDIEAATSGASVLRQTFEITGLLVPLFWSTIRRGAEQFDELGDDLARRLSAANA